MELVIKIDDDKYNSIMTMYDTFPLDMKEWGLQAIHDGVPLDKHDEELIKDTVASIWGEPCEDCISREEALEIMCDTCPMYNCLMKCSSYTHIEKMPFVTPQPKRGKWIEKTGEGFDAWAECSECGCANPFEDDFNYCPNCGAKMVESEEEQKAINELEKSTHTQTLNTVKDWLEQPLCGEYISREQTDILDKIRAEIKEVHIIGYATVDGKREIASRAVLQIIDKYKAESTKQNLVSALYEKETEWFDEEKMMKQQREDLDDLLREVEARR